MDPQLSAQCERVPDHDQSIKSLLSPSEDGHEDNSAKEADEPSSALPDDSKVI